MLRLIYTNDRKLVGLTHPSWVNISFESKKDCRLRLKFYNDICSIVTPEVTDMEYGCANTVVLWCGKLPIIYQFAFVRSDIPELQDITAEIAKHIEEKEARQHRQDMVAKVKQRIRKDQPCQKKKQK